MFEAARLTMQHFGYLGFLGYNLSRDAQTYAYFVIGPEIAQGFHDIEGAMIAHLGAKAGTRLIEQKQFLEVFRVVKVSDKLV